MSPIVSVLEFDIETSDIHDDGVAEAALVGNTNAGATGIKQKMVDYGIDKGGASKSNYKVNTQPMGAEFDAGVGRASPTYADVVENRSRHNDGTTLFGLNHTDGIYTTGNEDIMGSVESVARVSKPDVPKMLNLRSLVNEEKVDNADFVLPRDAIDKVKSKFEIRLWGIDQVLDGGPWLIRNTPLILNKWTPSLPLKKDVVTKVPIWVSSDSDLKKEVTMAVPNEDETSNTREVISVEYEWQPPRCADCKIFGHSSDRCPKIVRDPVSTDTNNDEFTEVKRKTHKGKKADMQPRRGADMDPTTKRSAINKDNQVEEREPRRNDHVESDDGVDEFIFPEGDKFGDKFDIRLKGRVRK
ncbi:uncharacterized vacuolar membrane protein [Tanacetum coccineum]